MSARAMLPPILSRPRKPAWTDSLEAPSIGRVQRAIVQSRSLLVPISDGACHQAACR
jgi:hypothetical protein